MRRPWFWLMAGGWQRDDCSSHSSHLTLHKTSMVRFCCGKLGANVAVTPSHCCNRTLIWSFIPMNNRQLIHCLFIAVSDHLWGIPTFSHFFPFYFSRFIRAHGQRKECQCWLHLAVLAAVPPAAAAWVATPDLRLTVSVKVPTQLSSCSVMVTTRDNWS